MLPAAREHWAVVVVSVRRSRGARLAAVLVVPQTLAGLERLLAASTGVRSSV